MVEIRAILAMTDEELSAYCKANPLTEAEQEEAAYLKADFEKYELPYYTEQADATSNAHIEEVSEARENSDVYGIEIYAWVSDATTGQVVMNPTIRVIDTEPGTTYTQATNQAQRIVRRLNKNHRPGNTGSKGYYITFGNQIF